MADDRDTEDYKKIELDDLDEFDFDRRAYDSLIQEAERDLKRGEDAAPENSGLGQEEKLVISVVAAIGALTLFNILSIPTGTAKVMLSDPSTIATLLGIGVMFLIALPIFLFRRRN
ncbi:MAG: hypothetical protein COY38_04265 [Candidatus Aenigmarchaeota archaeon CG_4_10_14_0_8_um_filter_37_24]|nr:hypothetical protein [Candidatus Aenigmarchaeota archaeon]OIN86961.1 MAG: hypothetical protein AUJ50_03410 [Candidatus Aenigmarchaeota archaeon CG1_02_38_14]PIV69325.1 MAG: hypothetical protein COS07_01145 [Candidatus Aenigmarchaeota archaeon CG01_land_8_20_14_3_00_37_9]PIW41263.1 MAG: hypothetical protein COW21_02865 [Candidatus Aenigmarchaeota archaeon CG15_BIG_FIL_POST_REV_8_21_14_020_37_27]PIX50882.1 MAG: hypothetical protein COZ52_01840 [Candidatus Aenigmarchaeota archaeon CG_4_8_14_3_u